jgi:hypothetical protein
VVCSEDSLGRGRIFPARRGVLTWTLPAAVAACGSSVINRVTQMPRVKDCKGTPGLYILDSVIPTGKDARGLSYDPRAMQVLTSSVDASREIANLDRVLFTRLQGEEPTGEMDPEDADIRWPYPAVWIDGDLTIRIAGSGELL